MRRLRLRSVNVDPPIAKFISPKCDFNLTNIPHDFLLRTVAFLLGRRRPVRLSCKIRCRIHRCSRVVPHPASLSPFHLQPRLFFRKIKQIYLFYIYRDSPRPFSRLFTTFSRKSSAVNCDRRLYRQTSLLFYSSHTNFTMVRVEIEIHPSFQLADARSSFNRYYTIVIVS